MSGGVVALVAAAGFVLGIPLTLVVNDYLARLRTDGIATQLAQWWGVALATAVAFALGSLATSDDWHLVPVLVAATGFAAVTATDVRAYRIANRILFPAIWATTATMLAVAVFNSGSSLADFARALVSGAVFCLVLLVLAIVARGGGLGLGDVKLAILLGLVLGWVARLNSNVGTLLLWALLLSSLFGVFGGLLLATARRLTGKNLLPDPDAAPDEPRAPILKTAFPFGPGLVLGTMIVVALAETIGI